MTTTREKADIVDRLRADLPHHADSFTQMSFEREEAADLVESLRRELVDSKAAHRDCIKRNIALARREYAALNDIEGGAG
jgi:hypothetical protein